MMKYVEIYSKGKPQLIEEDIFKIIIPLTPQVTPQVTPQADERIEKIMEFCIEPKTREEIQEYLNLKDRKYFQSEILKPLVENGLLKLTIPDKPKKKKKKYYSEKRLEK